MSKIAIAPKEARETNYWLRLLRDSKSIGNSEVATLLAESASLINILTAIVKTTQNSKPKTQNP